MLGSGVITVSAVSETAKETATTWGTPLQRRGRKRQPSHMYYQLKPSKIFDCSAFLMRKDLLLITTKSIYCFLIVI